MKAVCVVYLVVFSMCLYFPLTNQTLYVNVALGKETYQKNTNWIKTGVKGFSRLAVDGSTDPTYQGNSCSQTRSVANNYWVVDLAQVYPIQRINITNRKDKSHAEQLREFSIYVSNEDPRPGLKDKDPTQAGDLCLRHRGPFLAAGPHTVTCTSELHGRYVYVWKTPREVLTLCEFEVLVDSMYYYSTLLPSEPLHRGEISSKTSFFSSRMERFSRLACVGRCLLKQRREGSTLGLANLNGGNNTCDWPVIKTFCYKDEM